MTPTDEILKRLVELVKDDPPLHDAIVRWVNGMAANEEERAALAKARREKLG